MKFLRRFFIRLSNFAAKRSAHQRLQEELAELLPGCSELEIVDSIYGHDGFLVESEAVGELVYKTLELAGGSASGEGACPR